MATRSTDSLLISIDATVERLRRELQRGEAETVRFAQNIERQTFRVDAAFGKVGTALSTTLSNVTRLAAPFAAALGGFELGNQAIEALRFADALDDVAGQLQINVESLQELRFAAEESGVEVTTMENAIARLTAKIGDAVTGNKQAIESFQRVGIEFMDAAGNARSTEDVLRSLADRIQDLPTAAQKAAAAAEILGDRAGPRLVALLNQGSRGLEDLANSAREAGQVMSEETVKRLAEAERSWDKFITKMKIWRGEAVGFVLEFKDNVLNSDFGQSALRSELEKTQEAIQRIKDTMANRDAGGFLMGAFSDAQLQADLNDLLEHRLELLEAIQTRNKDDVVTVPASTVSGAGLGGAVASDPASADTIQRTREATSAIDEMSASLQQRLELLGLEARAQQELAAVYQLQAAARRDYEAGIRDSPIATEEEIAKVREMAGAVYDLGEAQRTAADGQQAQIDATRQLEGAFQSMGQQALNALVGIADGSKDAKSAVLDLVKSLASMLINAALAGVTGGASAPFSGIFSSLFTQGLGSLSFGGPRAAGGRVSKGMGYLVGEAGPEHFIPDVSGAIVPGVGSGGVSIAVTNNNTINATGGTMVQNRDLAAQLARSFEASQRESIRDVLRQELRPRGTLNTPRVGG